MPAKPFKKKSLQKLNAKRKRIHKSQQVSGEDSSQIQNPHKKRKSNQQNSVSKIRKLQLTEANADEDKTIKRMEKLLKLKKKKNKLPTAFKDEGLDYLLAAIDRKEGQTILSDYSDDLEEDLAAALGGSKASKKNTENKKLKLLERPQPKQRTLTELLREKGGKISSEDEQGKNDDEAMDDEFSSSDFDEDPEDNHENEYNDKSDNDNETEDGDSTESDDGTEEVSKKQQTKSKVWEDIYGRTRDERGNVLKNSEASQNLYVPPKLRKENVVDDSKKEERMKIKRQLKGLLNRLSESNIQSICHQIEEMYMKKSRNDMNETIFGLISELVFVSTLTPPRLIMEQAMLISLLHANVGAEVGAYFLQHMVEKLGDLFKSTGDYGDGKECNNVLVFLSHLYNFKVTHSTLVFNIFRILVDRFQSKDIELIQLLLKNIGFVMRKDDPLQLKELIISIQAKASEFNKKENDSRVKFMLDTLTAIRNNNMYKIPDYDPTIVEHSKKLLRGMIRKGCSMQELNISYEDLLKAEERGRWWIVGSAWAESDDSAAKNSQNVKETFALPKTEVSEKILELARKQHMNTEVRKSVFCILMTAEDFMDAFEKLIRLDLKNQQEREIIHVILHCVLNEKKFNLYYALLAGKFCTFARKHMMCLQFALWDKFKELSNMKSYKLNNLSRFLSHLFTSDVLPLSVLKVIHFSEMDKTMVKFFRQILFAILLHDEEEVCVRAFTRIAVAENLKLLRESLRLFMHHFVLRNDSKLEPQVALKLKSRVKLAEKALKPLKRIF